MYIIAYGTNLVISWVVMLFVIILTTEFYYARLCYVIYLVGIITLVVYFTIVIEYSVPVVWTAAVKPLVGLCDLLAYLLTLDFSCNH